LHAIPSTLFPNEDPSIRPALVVAHIALQFYLNDIYNLVTSGVKSSIEELRSSDDPIEHQEAQIRLRDLRKWQASEHPLHYNHYIELCRLVNPGGTTLPPSSAGQLVLKDFLASLIPLASGTSKTKPPYIKGGTFQSILPTAMTRLQDIARRQIKDPTTFIVEILMRVWVKLYIHNIPWSPVRDVQQRGRSITTTAYNSWSSFGAVSVPNNRLNRGNLRAPERQNAEMQAHLKRLREEDSDGPWLAGHVRIQDLHTVLHRRQLPEDFKMPQFSEKAAADYVQETYTFVQRTMDLENPLHQLALLYGIVFSRLAPNLFTEKPRNADHSHVATAASTKAYLSEIPWTTREKKGLTQKDIIMTMVTTLIVALYEETSPLRQYHKDHKGALGGQWTEKHSKCDYLSD
jgi:hypothetical protein